LRTSKVEFFEIQSVRNGLQRLVREGISRYPEFFSEDSLVKAAPRADNRA
jgi:hypothetical protein